MAYIGPFPVQPFDGGTGVANAAASTITLGGALTTSGAFASTFTMTNTTGVTFPTSGTLATTAQLPTLPLTGANGGTGVANTGSTITLGGNLTTSGAFASIFTMTAGTTVTFPTTGTLATTAQLISTPVSIANGGTFATSFTQSNGIVTYNGTRLVNYAGPQISSAGIQTNTAQPCFLVMNESNTGALTGDGTDAAVLFDTTVFDNASNITLNSSGKTIFTAPVTGRYKFDIWLQIYGGNFVATNNEGVLSLVTTARNYKIYNNPFASQSAANGLSIGLTVYADMAATNTAYLSILVAGVAKNTLLIGSGGGNIGTTWWSGALAT